MRNKQEWLRGLGSTRDGVYVVDATQRIVYWNKGAERILGYTQTEVLNESCYGVIAGRDHDKKWCHANCKVHRNVLRGALPDDYDVLTRTKQGKDIWINVSILALPETKKGKPLIMHLFRDVTQQKRNEETVQNMLAILGVEPVSKGKREDNQGSIRRDAPCICVPDPVSLLTRREVEILTLLAEGMTSKVIAQRLGVSPFTIRKHVQNALRKLGLKNKTQAVSFAFKNGLL